MFYPFNRIQLSNNKKQNTDTNNMNESHKHVEWKKTSADCEST